MFQLKIDRVVVPDLAADGLDVSIAESSNAAVRAAQQELIQLEHGNIKNVILRSDPPESSDLGGS